MGLILLSVDTSSRSGSVAITDGNALLAEWTDANAERHARWLMPAIDRLLGKSGKTISDIDLFACTTGPGSFTGLRIGVSVVKGLAWSLGKDVVPVSTLKVMAMGHEKKDDLFVCPLLDARKKEIYSSLYSLKEGRLEEKIEEGPHNPVGFLDSLLKISGERPVLFTGDGLDAYADLIIEAVPSAILAPKEEWPVKAANIASLALAATGSGVKPVSASALTPRYLRKSEAELKKKKAAPVQGTS